MPTSLKHLRYLALPLAALAALSAGCRGARKDIEPRPGEVKALLAADADARAEIVRQDPIAYLRRVGDQSRTLKHYTLNFTRYERRGLLQQLYGPEHMACWYRRQPFSVRMKWLDEKVKYGESAYVEGYADNKVRFVTRWPVPLLLPPPRVNKVDLQTPVVFGESKRPLTDFGLERLMDRTLASLDGAGEDVVVSYLGLLQLPDGGPTVHHIRLEYPATRYKVPLQELYVDIATDLPTGTILKYASGAIDASYFYADLDTSVKLTDADFLLEAERVAAGEKGTKAAAKKK